MALYLAKSLRQPDRPANHRRSPIHSVTSPALPTYCRILALNHTQRWCARPLASSLSRWRRAAFAGCELWQPRSPMRAKQCGTDGNHREFPGRCDPPSETLPKPDCIYLWSGWRGGHAVGATGSGEPGTFALPVMDVDHTRNVLGPATRLAIMRMAGGSGAPSPAALAFLNAGAD